MKKLMVVDDEADICNFVKNFFSRRDFEVTCASNGQEAVDIIEAVSPDITLMDIRMPLLDGIEALRIIKERNPGRRVIMVTCIDDLERMSEAMRLGSEGYITKPLVLDDLVKTVLEKMK